MDCYNKIIEKIEQLKKYHKHCVYGKSMLGQDLIAFHVGKQTSKQLLITGGIHAREYISTILCLYLIENYNFNVGCYILPMLNPDGIRLCIDGIDWIKDTYNKQLITRINKSDTFSLLKANAFGVDLNENFNAGFGQSKFIKFVPSSSGFLGEKPNNYENKYLLKYINKKSIFASISYHSKGQVVYYGYAKLNKNQLKNAKKLAKIVSKSLKFKKIRSKNSSGGLSDYLSYVKNIPSVTVELGKDNLSHPIQICEIDKIKNNQLEMIKNVIREFYD